MENEKLEKINQFLNDAGLSGTELKLKERCIDADQKRAAAIAASNELDAQHKELTNALNTKRLEVASLTQRIDELCGLILDLVDPIEDATVEAMEPVELETLTEDASNEEV